MKNLFIQIFTFSLKSLLIITAPAYSYHCELKARDHFQQGYETVTMDFTGEQAINIYSKNFRLHVQEVVADSKPFVAMQLKLDDEHSAVTMSPKGEGNLYLNLLQNSSFAIGTCTLSKEES